jgi:hypothetical protein
MRSNYREPGTKTLREQPFDAVYVSIIGTAHDSGPREVVHDLGKRVWVWADYSEHFPDSIVAVGDGRTNGYDTHGMRMISVPEYLCHFLSESEAEEIYRCREIDEAMLAAAV